MRKPFILLALIVLLTAVLAGPAAAQSSSADEGVLVRINGDVAVEAADVHGVIVVVDGNLDLDGTATTVVVVNGDTVLTGATVEELVVVSGTATLGPGTVVTGDVNLIDSTLNQDASATVEGTINNETGEAFTAGFWFLGLMFMIGWAILVLLSGLFLAAIAPDLSRRAGRNLTVDPVPSLLAGLILWIVAPVVGVLLFATLVGIPTALTIWVLVLPLLGFVGFLVAGMRIGDYIIARGQGTGHPYLASLVGLLALVFVGAIPAIGPLVVAVASFAGSGALALDGYRTVRNQSKPAPPMSAPAAEQGAPAPAGPPQN